MDKLTFIGIILIAVWFLPVLIANVRKHRSRSAIGILVLIGTFVMIPLSFMIAMVFGSLFFVLIVVPLVWCIAIMWSCTGNAGKGKV